MEDQVVLEVLDPTGEVAAGKKVPFAKRLDAFEQKTIGLVWNGKPNADVLLNFVEGSLKERFANLRINRYRMSNIAAPPKPDEIEGIAREVDAVIYASGD